jgi:hypothetical protein
MIRARCGVAIAVAGLLLVTAGTVQADVKAQQKTQTKFEGMLGRVMNLFGGSKAKDGIVQTVVVKGDRKATLGPDSGEIIDLDEEKIYELNFKNKSYKVKTFAELHKEFEDARQKAEEQARKSEDREKKDPNEKQMEVAFDIKDTGQKREINGYSCRQVVMTIAVHEKGKTLEQAGGLLMTADNWMAPTIAAMKEVADFDVRYVRKLGIEASARDFAQAMAMYPGMKDAMARLQKENVNAEGTAVQTIMTVQTVTTAEQAAAKKDEERPSPGGALGGMLGRFGRKKAEEPKDKEPAQASAAPSGGNKSTFMTTTSELVSVSTAIAPAELQIPAGFKQK